MQEVSDPLMADIRLTHDYGNSLPPASVHQQLGKKVSGFPLVFIGFQVSRNLKTLETQKLMRISMINLAVVRKFP